MSGLLHISQISYDRIENLEAVIQLNTVVKCMIIDHDKVVVAPGLASSFACFKALAWLQEHCTHSLRPT